MLHPTRQWVPSGTNQVHQLPRYARLLASADRAQARGGPLRAPPAGSIPVRSTNSKSLILNDRNSLPTPVIEPPAATVRLLAYKLRCAPVLGTAAFLSAKLNEKGVSTSRASGDRSRWPCTVPGSRPGEGRHANRLQRTEPDPYNLFDRVVGGESRHAALSQRVRIGTKHEPAASASESESQLSCQLHLTRRGSTSCLLAVVPLSSHCM